MRQQLLKLAIGALLATTIYCSCKRDEPVFGKENSSAADVGVITQLDTNNTVEPEELIYVAKSAFSNRSRSRQFTVSSIDTIFTTNGGILAYVLNYADNNGFTIISSDKFHQPILAHSDSSHFKMADVEHLPTAKWIKWLQNASLSLSAEDSLSARLEWNSLLAHTSKVSPLQTSQKSRSASFSDEEQKWLTKWRSEGWTIYSARDVMKSPTAYGCPLEMFPEHIQNRLNMTSHITWEPIKNHSYVLVRHEGSRTKHIEPKLETKWNQGYPYNLALIKAYPNHPQGITTPLGCTAVALGQIIYYKKSVPGYNYEIMEGGAGGTNERARFLFDLGATIGINYAKGETGATTDQLHKALEKLDQFYLSYSFRDDLVEKSLDLNCPVMVTGSQSDKTGHAWVCDGYSVWHYATQRRLMVMNENREDLISDAFLNLGDYPLESATKYYHYNWGWGGQSDGDFLAGDYKVDNYNFNQNPRILYYIYHN